MNCALDYKRIYHYHRLHENTANFIYSVDYLSLPGGHGVEEAGDCVDDTKVFLLG